MRGTGETAYELRCRECGKTYGVQPLSVCEECFSPLEVAYDLEYARTRFTREKISQGPANMWRYRALLPVADDYVPQTPSGFTPLVAAPRLARAHRRPQSLHQERRGVHAHAELQGSRGGGGAGQCAGVRIRYGGLLVDRQPGQCGGGACRAPGTEDLHPRSLRSRAGEDSEHPGVRRDAGARGRQLRPRQPAEHARSPTATTGAS